MSSGTDNLRDALRSIARETSSASTPDRVRGKLRAELRARTRRRRIAAWWPAAAAAALILGVWLGMPRQSPEQEPSQVAEARPAVMPPAEVPESRAVEEASAPTAAPLVLRESGSRPAPRPRARLASSSAGESRAVTPWFFYAGLPRIERGQVVGIQVSRETAAQFGVYSASGSVPAQVFIGDDGLTRAIRFVR